MLKERKKKQFRYKRFRKFSRKFMEVIRRPESPNKTRITRYASNAMRTHVARFLILQFVLKKNQVLSDYRENN